MPLIFENCEKLSKELRASYDEGDFQIRVKQRLAGISFGPYRVLLKSNFNTACWVPPAGSKEVHSFYYGDRMLERTIEFFCKKNSITWPPSPSMASNRNVSAAEKFSRNVSFLYSSLTRSQKNEIENLAIEAVCKYARHERAHAQYTSRNLDQTVKELKEIAVPFSLFNLFEDARCEHLDRTKTNEPFNWLNVEFSGLLDSPASLFFRCIQREGTEDEEAYESAAMIKNHSVSAISHRVRDYYVKACNCVTDRQLYPILVDFVNEFKEFFNSRDYDSDGGDLSYGAEAAEKGDAFFESFDKDAEDTSSNSDDTFPDEYKNHANTLEAFATSNVKVTEADFLSAAPRHLSASMQQRVEALTQMLMSMFKSHTLNTTSENPGHRMSGRHLARGELRFLHKKVFGGRKERKYLAIVDCSGSMKDSHIMENCMIFLLALNNLAKRLHIKGYLVLSGYLKKGPGWLRYSFPVDDSIILRIKPQHRGEGLQPCLADNLTIAKESDEVFVYTDANIGDAPMDVAFFKRHDVIPLGLYCGSADMLSPAELDMQQHFAQSIVKSSIEEIAEILVTRNKRVVG